MSKTKIKTSKGIFYFPSFQDAREYAGDRGYPTDRIISYDLGWAIQLEVSGDYVGPDTVYEWTQLDEFTTQFLETALWATSAEGKSEDDGGDGNPLGNLDDFIDVSDLSLATINRARVDCNLFREAAGDLLDDIEDSQAGHDFFLTREGHGAGFWDRGLGEVGDRLSKLCKPYGEFNFDERWRVYGDEPEICHICNEKFDKRTRCDCEINND